MPFQLLLRNNLKYLSSLITESIGDWKMTTNVPKIQKELMFCLSKSLCEVEAIQLALSMKTGDTWYIYKVGENPKAQHIACRESFVVVRPLRKAEIVKGGYGILIDRGKLRDIGLISRRQRIEAVETVPYCNV
jgi:hypothetical protein